MSTNQLIIVKYRLIFSNLKKKKTQFYVYTIFILRFILSLWIIINIWYSAKILSSTDMVRTD